MRLRNWLLTGTSAAFLIVAPTTVVRAQDPALVAAYQNYVAAQATGDAAAVSAAEAAFTEQCIVNGFGSIDECIGTAAAALAGQQPAAEEQPAPEEPAIEAPAPEEIVPEELPPETIEEAVPEPEVIEELPAEIVEEPAPETLEQAPEPALEEQPLEPAPEVVEEQPLEQQVIEEPQPETLEQAPETLTEPAPEQPAEQSGADAFLAALTAQVDAYNAAVASISVGGDPAAAQAQMTAAEAEINSLCGVAGYTDVATCLADYGLALQAVQQPPEPEPEVVQEPVPETVPEEQVQEPAPEQQLEQPAPEQQIEQPAPEQQVEQPTPEQQVEQPSSDPFTAALSAQVQAYNAAAASVAAGGDPAAAQAQMTAAEAEINSLCGVAGYTDIAICLADYGLALDTSAAPGQLPAGDPAILPEGDPALQPEGEPATDLGAEPALDPALIQEQLLNDPALIDQPTEDITTLPEGVAPEEVAPLLDSAKDQVTRIESGNQTSDTAPEQQPVAEPAGPAPTTDAEAQAQVTVAPEQIQSATAEQGEALEAAPEVVVPQNITIINQVTNNNTTVNNTTVNNSTVNNTTVNNTTNNGVADAGQPGGSISFDVNFVYQVNNEVYINNTARERDRIAFEDEQTYYERLPNGRTRETIERADGTRIVTVRARNGDIVRRSRITPDGREYVLAYFDEEFEDDLVEYRDPGEDLPPLRLNISVSEYVLDAEFAEEDEVEEFFSQPPVEEVRRLYSIDEVKRSARIRDSVRRLEVGGLTFDSGKATISRDQVATLSKVAEAMLDLLERNPAETFLIEGHTDAVGTDVSNLTLSDLRASTVARILTDFYDIPPENLATQGYGERYLKIRTEADERENRRVTIRRITALVTPLVASN